MEILDIYDSNRMPTGRTFVRGTKPEGGYYLVAQVIVFNTKGQMLIQQRQAHKLGWPNRWDVSAGGSVQAARPASRRRSANCGRNWACQWISPACARMCARRLLRASRMSIFSIGK